MGKASECEPIPSLTDSGLPEGGKCKLQKRAALAAFLFDSILHGKGERMRANPKLLIPALEFSLKS